MAYTISKSGNVTTIKGGSTNVRTKAPGTVTYNAVEDSIQIFFSDVNYRSPVSFKPDNIETIDGASPSSDLDTLLEQIIECMPDSDMSSRKAAAITPSNSTNLSQATRGIYVGVTGDVTAVINGTAILFKNAVQGSILPVQATRVNSTGTTATNLVALY